MISTVQYHDGRSALGDQEQEVGSCRTRLGRYTTPVLDEHAIVYGKLRTDGFCCVYAWW